MHNFADKDSTSINDDNVIFVAYSKGTSQGSFLYILVGTFHSNNLQ